MTRTSPCPRCGVGRPTEELSGLCPRCLLEQGLDDRTTGTVVTQILGVRTTANEGPSPGAGVLTILEASVGEISRVMLREAISDSNHPPARPTSPEMPPRSSDTGRYQLLGEIARGGMGAVLKGRDVDLGRDLAVKVLLECHRENPELIRRFVEEAQIGGQLQHPGIVPVYEMGQFSDRRPFFTMKLVKGRTLAALMRDRPGPQHDLPSFLSIFEAICQTMAYAHSRGVIHRDLKPSNIMVGSFGEVQVMDWGLAKVLSQGGVADERMAPAPETSVIRTVRSGSEADASQVGSVLGTPAYMAPEQARGEIESTDERADVFGLGAILCEILTGQPPFVGRSGAEVLQKVRLGDLTEARARLDSAEIDAELVVMARHCLMPLAADRPRSASDVAVAITGYLAGVQRRLREAELGRLEERGRRRLTAAVSSALLIIGGLVGGGAYWLERGRAERRGVVLASLERARLLLDQAIAAVPEGPGPWDLALAAAEQAAGLLQGGRTGLEDEVAVLRQQVGEGKQTAETDRALLRRLADIRASKAEARNSVALDADYALTFRDAGLDLDALKADRVASAINDRHPSLRSQWIGYLDDWAVERRRSRPKDEARGRQLAEVARLLDPDPRRDRLRAIWPQRDLKPQLEPLRAMAREARTEDWPLPSLGLLASSLSEAGDPDAAADLLRLAVRVHPHDPWLNFDLAYTLQQCRPPRVEEAIRYYTAARALRPEAGHELAHALAERGQGEDAVAILRELTTIRPDSGKHWLCLGTMLSDRGDRPGAASAIDRGISRMETERIARSDDFAVRSNLALAYRLRRRFAEALALCREALAAWPDDAVVHYNLGHLFKDQGRLDEAIAEFREAAKFNPDDPDIQGGLAAALNEAVRLDEAVAASREAVRLRPDFADSRYDLGLSLLGQGKAEEAIVEFRESSRIRPDYALPHSMRGAALFGLGRHDEAILAYREAIRLKPDFAEPHANLGMCLRSLGRYAEAAAELRKGVDLLDGQKYSSEIEAACRATERQALLDTRLPAVLRGEERPGRSEGIEFANLCYDKRWYAASTRLFEVALGLEPAPGQALEVPPRYNALCSAVLAADGRGRDEPPPDEIARARFRRQAQGWMEAEVGAWAAVLGRAEARPEDRDLAIRSLRHSREDADLASVREPAALTTLPEADRAGWLALWAEVDRQLERVPAKP